MGQARNQVGVDASNARLLHPPNVLKRDRPRMQTASGLRLLINKRLHAKADAVHAALQHGVERIISQLPWRALDRNLGIASQHKMVADLAKKRFQQIRWQ